MLSHSVNTFWTNMSFNDPLEISDTNSSKDKESSSDLKAQSVTELSSENHSSQKEKPISLAGPSMGLKAVNRMRRIMGEKEVAPFPRSKYVNPQIFEKIDRLNEEIEREKQKELEEAQALGRVIAEQNSINKQKNDGLHQNISDNEDNPQVLSSPTQLTESAENVDENHINDSYFRKAMGTVNRMEKEKNQVLLKIRRNFRYFFIIIVAFIGYYAYQTLTYDGNEQAVASLQSQLPVELDKKTKLVSASLLDNTLELKIVKASDSFENALNLNDALDIYVERSSKNFCSLEFFKAMISGGTKVKVLLDAEDGSFHREFNVDKCSR